MAPITEEHITETKKLKNKAKASLALLLIAVISISTATYAWFSLSNSTSVQSMIVEVGTGTVLKAYAGVTTSTTIDDYYATIRSEGTTSVSAGEIITDALPKKATTPGVLVDMKSLNEIKLWPVTSGVGTRLYTQGGNASSSTSANAGPEMKYYVELKLTFITDTAMDVYLNSENSSTDFEDGTLVLPGTTGKAADENAVKALRISFESTDDFNNKTSVIYEPGKTTGTDTRLGGNALRDFNAVAGNTGTTQKTFWLLGDNTGRKVGGDETPVLFSLAAGEPKVVTIRMWVEGEDKECVNNDTINIEKAKMNIRFRFCGADENGNYIETAPK